MQNMLLVAQLMIAAAAGRHESRGVHFRRDFPQPDPAMSHHLTFSSPTTDGPPIDASYPRGSTPTR